VTCPTTLPRKASCTAGQPCYDLFSCKSKDGKKSCVRPVPCDYEIAATTCQGNRWRPVRNAIGFLLTPVDGSGIRWEQCSDYPDCIREVSCEPTEMDAAGNPRICMKKISCGDTATDPATDLTCVTLESCDAPCNGFKLIPADTGFALEPSDTGLRFKPCDAAATCFTAIDGCIASGTGPNNLCVKVVPNCPLPGTNQMCYRREPCCTP